MRKPRGFTMIELVVTMIIVGILVVTVLPRFDGLGTFDAAGYADQTTSLIRYAQKTAVAQRRWTAVDVVAGTLCSQTALPVGGCAAGCAGGVTINPPGGTPQASTTVAGNTTLCFDSLGRPIASGTSAPLAANATLTISDAGVPFRTITIHAETGHVQSQ